jgi:hypothetical protein
MRKMFLSAALIVGFAAAGSLVPSQADAMPISSPSAVQDAIGNGALQQVRYVCYRVRHCGWRGCYYRRVCDWRPSHRYWGWRHHHRRHYGWY